MKVKISSTRTIREEKEVEIKHWATIPAWVMFPFQCDSCWWDLIHDNEMEDIVVAITEDNDLLRYHKDCWKKLHE